MECRDYARIDMRIDAHGRPWILEVNPNPDLAVGGAFETCARASGRSYPQTLAAIVELALRRSAPVERRERARTDEIEAVEPTIGAVEPTDEMLRRHMPRDAA
jgi:D-alanine-D-alanine ligase